MSDGHDALDDGVPLREAARRAGVTAPTLRRWARTGVIPQDPDAPWAPPAVALARIVARLRERGHSLEQVRRAAADGRLAFGYVEDLLSPPGEYTTEEAAAATGLEPALVERVTVALGFPAEAALSDDDLRLLRYVAAVLDAGFPLVALLQLVRVYGQALSQMADAEVRLFHLYVHEPLMRDGVAGLEISEEMEALARELLPLASPLMDTIHRRFLAHFIEQDVIGHMEAEIGQTPLDLGRLRVAIAFADLAGYTRLTEEEGELEAVNAVERFIDGVEQSLPEDARVIKTIGDAVMVVGSDPAALAAWAVAFQEAHRQRPLPRIGMHFGETLYRDGDYFGREVNIASRVAARAGGGEVLVTRPVVDAAGRELDFEQIGEVRLKGFSSPTELFLARAGEEED